MRKLWFAGVAVVALLGAGCTQGPTTTPTTAAHGSATTVKGHDTNKAKGKGKHKVKGSDKAACAEYVTIHNLGTTAPTPAEYRTFVKDLRHAPNATLKKAGTKVAQGITNKNANKLKNAVVTVGKTCTTLGLG
jgi:hypothetical protein